MNKKTYPKILIFGQSFNLNTGGGITKANLFKGWPHDKIAVATPRIDLSGIDYCRTYYRIGYEEDKRPYPFNLLQPKYKSEHIYLDGSRLKNNKSKNKYELKKSQYNLGIKKVLYSLLHFLGIYYLIFRLKVSDKFLAWIDEYKPEIIYTQLSKLEYIKFIDSLINKRNIPLVIHIMDDWPKTINMPGLFSFYWGRIINRGFRRLQERSALLMSICQKMSDEYLKRYKNVFIPFLNTIEWGKLKKYSKNNRKFSGSFKVLYAGRIGPGTSESVFSIVKAIKILKDKGLDIEFQLQTKRLDKSRKERFARFDFVKFNPFIAYEDIPKKLSDVDLLILPMDFNKRNLNFIQLSMPTKVPEYMSSGTPILVFADKSTALYEYASTYKWAYTVTENNIQTIARAIETLYNKEKIRETIASNAINVARTNHDAEVVRENFRKILLNIIDDKIS